MTRRFIYIVAALALLVGIILPSVAFADTPTPGPTTGASTGTFTTANSTPQVTNLELYSDLACTTPATHMDPQVTYYVKFTVTDLNSLNDIALITVKLFYDAAGTDLIDESTITAGAAKTAAILTWTKSGDAWAIDPTGGGTSWYLDTASCLHPTGGALGNNTGDWKFAFKPGKVATESLGSADWDIHARATDSLAATGGMYKYDKGMNWYGEVAVSTPSVTWLSIAPGTDFGGTDSQKTDISVKYIANGNYNEKVKSTATWVGANNTANLDDVTGDCTNPLDFALKAYHNATIGSSVLVDTTGVVIHDTVTPPTQTLESGNTEGANTLWLKLNNSFPNDTYTGTLTYIVDNRV